jgi:sulfate permease, SulP family
VLFARRVAHFATVTRTVEESPTGQVARYTVVGELFFASSNDLTTQFEYAADPAHVVIDMSGSHIWDASTVAALDAIVTKYERHDKRVTLSGMNETTRRFHRRLSGELGAAG